MTWVLEDVSNRERISSLAMEAIRQFRNLHLEQDLEWLHTTGVPRGRKLVVLSSREDGNLVGLAPLEAENARLQFRLADLTVWSEQVARFNLEAEPLLGPDAGNAEMAECFAALSRQLPRNGVVFLRGVPTNSRLHGVLTERNKTLRRNFYIVPHGPVYSRCRIQWDGSFENYLNSLGKVTRKDLRRTLKKAPAILGQEPRLVRYTTVEEAGIFLKHAAEVSGKTYQAKLGVGIKWSPERRAEYETAARNQRFLGHVLFLGEQPVSFHLGYVYGSSLYMVNGGYDPAWAKAQLGMYTFLKVLQDIEASKTPLTILDYLYGDSVYKTRTSNHLTDERHFYLTKRSVRGAMLAGALRATDAFSRSVGNLLDRLGLKQSIKKFLREKPGKALSLLPMMLTIDLLHLD
jgi:Acetyltransferase (GNAT) domain